KEPQPLRVAVRAERRQGPLERLAAQHRRGRVVDLAEARVETDGKRVRLEQSAAEAVDGRDPRSVERARQLVPAPVVQRTADPGPQFAGRLARVRDDADGVD